MNVLIKRRGIITVVLAGFAVAGLAGASLIAFPSSAHSSSTSDIDGQQPRHIAAVLRHCGITPEALAASGADALACGRVFDTATVYCFQANRLEQIQLAYAELNRAKERAVRPAKRPQSDAQPRLLTVQEAQTAVDNLLDGGFDFITTSLDATTRTRLRTIRANSEWEIPAEYLVVNRSEQEWINLRGALATKRYRESTNESLDARPAQVLSTADTHAAVTQARQAKATGLASIEQVWNQRSRATARP